METTLTSEQIEGNNESTKMRIKRTCQFGRTDPFSLSLAGTTLNTYGYDGANRLQSIASPAGSFTYAYDAGLEGNSSSSSLVRGIALPGGSAITNTFDAFARLTSTWLLNSAGVTLDYSDYSYNAANQRTGSIRKSGSAMSSVGYTYDPIGQLTSDLASEITSGAPRLNEQLSYAYDAAGNLQARTNNALVQSFAVNALNELTNAANGGRLTVAGVTSPQAASVTVNTTNAILYADGTFAATNMPIAPNYTAVAQDGLGRQVTTNISVNLPSTVGYQYDGNGNLTNDGLRSFAYDAENQLTNVQVAGQWRSQFQYDGKMRRRVRKEFAWLTTSWVQTNEVHYLYDGNVVIQERDGNNVAQVTYTRGKDLSGRLEGAGGIGGLLARQSAISNQPSPAFYHADGNGNVTAMTDGTNVLAKYLYDAFGNTLAKSGALAEANLYRFSSKEWHQNSGLVYYLYRYYDPNLQRWVNRDPLGDGASLVFMLRKSFQQKGGILSYREMMDFTIDGVAILNANLYEFVANSPALNIDILGLWPWSPKPPSHPAPPPPPPPSCPPGGYQPCTGLASVPEGQRGINWQTRCKLCVDDICTTPGVSNPAGCAQKGYDSCDDGQPPTISAPVTPPKTGPGKPSAR